MPTHAQRLIHAVRTGNYVRLRELIASHGEMDARSPAGRTALHAAAEEADLEAARILIESGAAVNALMNGNQTPLHLAAGYGGFCDLMDPDQDRANPCSHQRHHPINPALAEVLTQILKETNSAIPADLTPESAIPMENKPDVFLAVLEAFSDRGDLYRQIVSRGIDLDRVDPHFSDSLRGRPRYLRMAAFLLDHGADINAADDSGHTPLRGAVELGTAAMVELLLKRGAEPNPKTADEPEESLVGLALEYSKVEIADVLLRHGATFDPNGPWYLHEAASNGRAEALEWLLQHGAEVDRPDQEGATALLNAAASGHHEIVARLIAHHANPAAHNQKGGSLLHSAGCWPECLAFALPLGLPINEQNAAGATPLHLAAQSANPPTVHALLRAGATASAQDHDGNTPLHSIFFSEEFRPDIEFPVFHALVAAGADPSIRNKEGKTPFDLATQWRYPEEYLALLQCGSDARSAGSFIWLGSDDYLDFLPQAIKPFELEGQLWPSCEHYFQAQKVNDPEIRERIRQAPSAADAVCRFRESKLKPSRSWPKKCDTFMRSALLAKFTQHAALRDALLATGTATLISDSNCESYWTERPGVVFNTIGKMLMEIRAQLRSA